MALDRTIVSIGGPLAIVSGLVCATATETLTGMAGITATPSGVTDLRAVYGGFQIGLGVFLLWCRSDPARIPAGLLALGLAVGSLGALRVIGLLVDGEPNAFHAANLTIEAATTALVAFAFAKRRTSLATA
jgi:hypothetical protein